MPFALFLKFSEVKDESLSNGMISGNLMYKLNEQMRKSCQRSSVDFDVIKIAFRKLIDVSTIWRIDFLLRYIRSIASCLLKTISSGGSVARN